MKKRSLTKPFLHSSFAPQPSTLSSPAAAGRQRRIHRLHDISALDRAQKGERGSRIERRMKNDETPAYEAVSSFLIRTSNLEPLEPPRQQTGKNESLSLDQHTLTDSHR